MHKFRKLKVWQKGMEFVALVYRVSSKYPKSELFGLTDQIRRAAVSVALSIAEGSGSGSDPEFNRFLKISLRSGYEVITAAEIAIMLNYGIKEENQSIIEKADELGAMITGLMKTLKKSDS